MTENLIILFLFFTACSPQVDKKKVNEDSTSIEVSKNESLKTQNNNPLRYSELPIVEGQKVIFNTFAAAPFKNKLSIDIIDSLLNHGFVQKIAISENTHSQYQLDTTIMCENKAGTKIVFQVAGNKSILTDVILEDNTCKLSKNIRIGITKNDFFDILGVPPIEYSEVIVTDDEEWNLHRFFFKEGILTRIEFYFGID